MIRERGAQEIELQEEKEGCQVDILEKEFICRELLAVDSLKWREQQEEDLITTTSTAVGIGWPAAKGWQGSC